MGIKIEVMGTGPGSVYSYYRRKVVFKSVTKYRSKITAVHGAAFGTALKHNDWQERLHIHFFFTVMERTGILSVSSVGR